MVFFYLSRERDRKRERFFCFFFNGLWLFTVCFCIALLFPEGSIWLVKLMSISASAGCLDLVSIWTRKGLNWTENCWTVFLLWFVIQKGVCNRVYSLVAQLCRALIASAWSRDAVKLLCELSHLLTKSYQPADNAVQLCSPCSHDALLIAAVKGTEGATEKDFTSAKKRKAFIKTGQGKH